MNKIDSKWREEEDEAGKRLVALLIITRTANFLWKCICFAIIINVLKLEKLRTAVTSKIATSG